MAKRWIRQRTSSSCGPVALMNLKKWLDHSVSYARDFEYWKRKCRCKKYGTALPDFVRALYSINDIKISPRTVPNIGIISEALYQDKAVVMKSAYYTPQGLEGHYFLITDQTDKSFFCVNLSGKHFWVSKSIFAVHWLQHHPNYCYECGVAPYCWIIRKI
jgi:hypothetical protein